MSPRPSPPDLVRSIYLLWGHHPGPGRSGLSVEAIVTAGIEVADASGLESLSMRKVADRIGAGTMSLYAHVPSKEDLTALMVDAVFAELYGGDLEAAVRQGDWRAGMAYVAQRNWDLYTRHPWLLDVRASRPSLGPHASRKYETELRPLDGIGLSDVAMESALSLILSHVETTARAGQRLSRIQDESGLTESQWWAVVGPALGQAMGDAADDLKVAGRVGMAVGEQFDASTATPDHALSAGLETILSGIQAELDRA